MFAYLVVAAAMQAEVPPNNLSYAEAGKLMVASERKQAQVRSQIKKWPEEQVAAELRKAISGKTKLIYQIGHGVYVEYTAPDGQLRMWYPRNRNVVKGSWGVRTLGSKTRACFSYSNAVNPVTQVYEPTECVKPEQTLSDADVMQSWDGDIFGLMSDRIPYVKGVMDIPSPPDG